MADVGLMGGRILGCWETWLTGIVIIGELVCCWLFGGGRGEWQRELALFLLGFWEDVWGGRFGELGFWG